MSNLEASQRYPDTVPEFARKDRAARNDAEPGLSPTRGLVPFQNASGAGYAILDIRRWVRLCRVLHKTEKIDLFVKGKIPETFNDALTYTADADIGMGVSLSLRTDCAAAPPDMGSLKSRGLYDVFLCPPSCGAPHLQSWLEACQKAELPVRLQIAPPFPKDFDVEDFSARVAAAGVKWLNINVSDPFSPAGQASKDYDSQAQVALMTGLSARLEERGIPAKIVGIPFCLVAEEDRGRVSNRAQFFRDHHQYQRGAYDMALQLYPRRRWVTAKILLLKLGRETSRGTTADLYLLAWLANEHPYGYALVSLYRKLTRHIGILNRLPKPIAQTGEAYEAEIEKLEKKRKRQEGPTCSLCRLRRICDRESPSFKRVLPGLAIAAEPGEEPYASPFHYARNGPVYYDSIDSARRVRPELEGELAQQALNIVNGEPPDRDFGIRHYAAEDTFCRQLPGAVQWLSLSNTEKMSTTLAWLEAPFTISIVFGGGIADYIGFSLGHYVKVLCPMETYSHRVVLHVDRQGHYVLLRDGAVIRPVEFEGRFGAPALIPTMTPVRLSLWNIDRYVYTQNLLMWEGATEAKAQQEKVKYSIITVCMRFSRRLQAVLQCIAHQEGIDFSSIEIIVAYIPGLDATDDVISSLELAHPELRIVRAPFSERHDNAKGYVINQAMDMASGEWIVLLDSDTLIPPDLMARIATVPETTSFIAPDRRKMIPREVTAKVLLGEIEPWRDWQSLLEGPGEMRVQEGGNLPIGFLQCVRAELAKSVRYEEYSHFQGADWDFIVNVHREGGPGTWLKDVPVCHLDHGGSQWYGARKHL